MSIELVVCVNRCHNENYKFDARNVLNLITFLVWIFRRLCMQVPIKSNCYL